MQKKLSSGKLLSKTGELVSKGYNTSLVASYCRKDIKASKWRIKEWDYYLIYNKEYAIALTIADNSYMQLLSASVIDFTKPCETTKSAMQFFTFGKTKLPESSKIGDTIAKNKELDIRFLNNGKDRQLKLAWNNYDKGKNLVVDIVLKNEPRDSMVIATPFKENKKAFYYNQKIVGFSASGRVVFGDKEIIFDEKESVALLDWGRGVWTYKNVWYWGAAAGKVNDKPFAFNIGYGFGDNSAATENMLFYNGWAHKLNDVKFEIPQTKDKKEDYMKPWKISSSDGRFEMDFKPIIDRKNYSSALIISSDQHQVFGTFNGKVVLDDGKELQIENLLGFAEKVKNKW